MRGRLSRRFNGLRLFPPGHLPSPGACCTCSIVSASAMPTIAALARIAPNASFELVMNHRSNADYLLVAYLATTRAELSYAVGEWTRIWLLQSLIKALDGFFVRRSSDNPLYRRVLARYVQMATAGGVVQAFYPEGR